MTTYVVVPMGLEMADAETLMVADRLATRSGRSIELVSVTDERHADRAKRHLAAVASGLDADVSWRIIEDADVDSALVGEALSRPDSLVCMTSLARGAVAESMWGSISESLARDAGVPIVLVGPKSSRDLGIDGGVMLVPVDGTIVAESMLGDAFKIADSLGLGVRIVQVVAPIAGEGSLATMTGYVRRLAEEWRDASRFEVDFDVLHGDNAARAITDYIAGASDVRFVAMATRGVPAAGRLFYPSTTFSVLRHCEVPVVVLHPLPAVEPSEEIPPCVVVGLDDMKSSRKAVRWAAEEADRRGIPLRIVHAWAEPYTVTPGGMPFISAAVHDEFEHLQLEMVDEAIAYVHETFPSVAVETVVACDGVTPLVASSSKGAIAVVLGRHHGSRVIDKLFGSVAETVGHRVACPIVTVMC